jgi:hypothetical protein
MLPLSKNSKSLVPIMVAILTQYAYWTLNHIQ